jgi:TIR domain
MGVLARFRQGVRGDSVHNEGMNPGAGTDLGPEAAASGGVFISYRRDDSEHAAGRLYDRLVDQFGERSIFMDVSSVEPGLDFHDVIDSAMAKSDVILILIGEHWLKATDNQGQRRLDDPDDLVRLVRQP